jgi:transcriptional regulator GlxA family with amidase domain
MRESAPGRSIRADNTASRQSAVARAEAYLRANLDAPLPVARLSRIVGLSERGLRAAFYSVRGTSPKRWIVAERLRGVRDVLCDESATPATVTVAAAGCGFSELGRFAGLYRHAYGETPSDTLRSTSRRKRGSAV